MLIPKYLVKKNTLIVLISFLLALIYNPFLGGNIFISISNSKFAIENSNRTRTKGEVRILCLCLTYPGQDKFIISVIDTWGKRCTKLYFLANLDNKNLGTETVPLNITKEGRDMLWEKVRQGFQFAYDKHFNEFDWFVKADDDTYFIMDNLRYFLSKYDPNQPYYFGEHFKTLGGYNSGGAGYVLSRKSLEHFINSKNNFPESCPPGFGAEDVEMGRCLAKFDVHPSPAIDKWVKPLFRCFNYGYLYHADPNMSEFWIHHYSKYPVRVGDDCCPQFPISFHYMGEEDKYMVEFFLHHTRVDNHFDPTAVFS